MTDKEVRRAMKRLCSAAMIGQEYHPESCQRCQSPCRHGTALLRDNGIARIAQKETPMERADMMGSRRIRNIVHGLNRYSVIK